jgi:putative transcriptional regulator
MIDPGAGILLVADPFLKDPNFHRTVVFLCEHNENGSFGYVLNRQYVNTLDQFLPGLEEHKLPVYYGGPVQQDSIHFLHQYPEEIPGGQEVMKGIFWGGNFDALVDKIKSPLFDPDKIRLFIGYSGWETGQLEGEIEEKSWLTVKDTPNILFHENYTEIWKDALKLMGGEYEMMINFPTDPQLN